MLCDQLRAVKVVNAQKNFICCWIKAKRSLLTNAEQMNYTSVGMLIFSHGSCVVDMVLKETSFTTVEGSLNYTILGPGVRWMIQNGCCFGMASLSRLFATNNLYTWSNHAQYFYLVVLEGQETFLCGLRILWCNKSRLQARKRDQWKYRRIHCASCGKGHLGQAHIIDIWQIFIPNHYVPKLQ